MNNMKVEISKNREAYGDGYLILIDSLPIRNVSCWPSDRSKDPSDPDALWMVAIDGRLGYEVGNREEVIRWGALLGDAMAVAAGYKEFHSDVKLHPVRINVRAEAAEKPKKKK